MTKADYLQRVANELRENDQWDFEIVFRPGKGWYGITEEPRYWGDDGEYLGENWGEAEKALRNILG